jgi:hypothetical protein
MTASSSERGFAQPPIYPRRLTAALLESQAHARQIVCWSREFFFLALAFNDAIISLVRSESTGDRRPGHRDREVGSRPTSQREAEFVPRYRRRWYVFVFRPLFSVSSLGFFQKSSSLCSACWGDWFPGGCLELEINTLRKGTGSFFGRDPKSWMSPSPALGGDSSEAIQQSIMSFFRPSSLKGNGLRHSRYR